MPKKHLLVLLLNSLKIVLAGDFIGYDVIAFDFLLIQGGLSFRYRGRNLAHLFRTSARDQLQLRNLPTQKGVFLGLQNRKQLLMEWNGVEIKTSSLSTDNF